jgi:hypothetical protein
VNSGEAPFGWLTIAGGDFSEPVAGRGVSCRGVSQSRPVPIDDQRDLLLSFGLPNRSHADVAELADAPG